MSLDVALEAASASALSGYENAPPADPREEHFPLPWRRLRDLNPRWAINPNPISSRASSRFGLSGQVRDKVGLNSNGPATESPAACK